MEPNAPVKVSGFWLPPELHKHLKITAANLETTMGSLVIQAVQDLLQKLNDPK